MLNYPSAHNDTIVLTDKSYATHILSDAENETPEQGGSTRMVIWNLMGVKGPVIEGQKGPRVPAVGTFKSKIFPLDARQLYMDNRVETTSRDWKRVCQHFQFTLVRSTTILSRL